MPTITGLTAVQRDIADRLWSLDTTAEINDYIHSLPRSLKREAWVVMQMIIWAELDQVMEITDEVQDYLHSR
jgi:hypothetical protein